MKIVGLSGSLTNPSRTTTLVSSVLTSAAQSLHASAELVTISSLGADLGSTINPERAPDSLRAAQQKLVDADLIVVGTPIYKAAYTGLLKHFFDLLDPEALRGKVAILAATGGSEHHALVLEHQLRPLLSFFGVHTVPTALFARDASFSKDAAGAYGLADDTLLQRIHVSIDQARTLFNAGTLRKEAA
jgi:FMN reductase